FDLLEHDGPYPGNLDAAARPPLQKGVEDSRWVQWSITAEFYSWCRGRGIYLNTPDWYYLVGSTKCGMGYREVNWSLPRAQQVIHTRQNIFDGTRHKRPSMGWMFVPLTQYHGGGAAATVEPLDQHGDHYRRMLESNLGAGVQACYRGPQLYDTEAVRDLVADQVRWYKAHRDVLEAPIVHGSSRRADGRGLDWLLHADPRLPERGMLCVYNPSIEDRVEILHLDVYYTGAQGQIRVTDAGGSVRDLPLDRRHRVALEVNVPAGGMSWYSMR
ncbi:MAG: alpha-galactosidase, partial [Planctomycetota bacterium]|nr:alpha-galactosidase [Planctomycetota bacterium]